MHIKLLKHFSARWVRFIFRKLTIFFRNAGFLLNIAVSMLYYGNTRSNMLQILYIQVTGKYGLQNWVMCSGFAIPFSNPLLAYHTHSWKVYHLSLFLSSFLCFLMIKIKHAILWKKPQNDKTSNLTHYRNLQFKSLL